MDTLLLALIVTAAPADVKVQTLDGRTLTAAVLQLDASRASLQTPEGVVSIPVDQLLAVTPLQPPPAPGKRPDLHVELVDGSALAARQYTASGGRAQIALGDGQVVEAPTAAVASVRFQYLTEPMAAEWSRILKLPVQNDVLVVREEDTVDYHKGVLRDVSDAVIQFDLDGDVLPVKRGKILGLVYFHAPGQELPEPVCELVEANGSRWSVASLAMPGDLQWTTPSGLTVTRPWTAVANIDFSRGKVVFLSDLRPQSVTFTPYFGTTERLPVLEKFYAPREDKNLESGPLCLADRVYAKGLALHSRTRVVYRLPDRFRRFQATVGIDDGVRPQGNVRLVVSGDDKVLLETVVTGADPPKPVDVDVTGVRRLEILVDFGENLDVGDHLDLCEARVAK